MRRQRGAHWLFAGEARHDRPILAGGGEFVFAGARLQLLELQLELVEQLGAAFGRWPEALAPQFGDDQFEMRHHGLGPSGPGLGLVAGLALGDQCRFKRLDPVGENVGCDRHGGDSTTIAGTVTSSRNR